MNHIIEETLATDKGYFLDQPLAAEETILPNLRHLQFATSLLKKLKKKEEDKLIFVKTLALRYEKTDYLN